MKTLLIGKILLVVAVARIVSQATSNVKGQGRVRAISQPAALSTAGANSQRLQGNSASVRSTPTQSSATPTKVNAENSYTASNPQRSQAATLSTQRQRSSSASPVKNPANPKTQRSNVASVVVNPRQLNTGSVSVGNAASGTGTFSTATASRRTVSLASNSGSQPGYTGVSQATSQLNTKRTGTTRPRSKKSDARALKATPQQGKFATARSQSNLKTKTTARAAAQKSNAMMVSIPVSQVNSGTSDATTTNSNIAAAQTANGAVQTGSNIGSVTNISVPAYVASSPQSYTKSISRQSQQQTNMGNVNPLVNNYFRVPSGFPSQASNTAAAPRYTAPSLAVPVLSNGTLTSIWNQFTRLSSPQYNYGQPQNYINASRTAQSSANQQMPPLRITGQSNTAGNQVTWGNTVAPSIAYAYNGNGSLQMNSNISSYRQYSPEGKQTTFFPVTYSFNNTIPTPLASNAVGLTSGIYGGNSGLQSSPLNTQYMFSNGQMPLSNNYQNAQVMQPTYSLSGAPVAATSVRGGQVSQQTQNNQLFPIGNSQIPQRMIANNAVNGSAYPMYLPSGWYFPVSQASPSSARNPLSLSNRFNFQPTLTVSTRPTGSYVGSNVRSTSMNLNAKNLQNNPTSAMISQLNAGGGRFPISTQSSSDPYSQPYGTLQQYQPAVSTVSDGSQSQDDSGILELISGVENVLNSIGNDLQATRSSGSRKQYGAAYALRSFDVGGQRITQIYGSEKQWKNGKRVNVASILLQMVGYKSMGGRKSNFNQQSVPVVGGLIASLQGTQPAFSSGSAPTSSVGLQRLQSAGGATLVPLYSNAVSLMPGVFPIQRTFNPLVNPTIFKQTTQQTAPAAYYPLTSYAGSRASFTPGVPSSMNRQSIPNSLTPTTSFGQRWPNTLYKAPYGQNVLTPYNLQDSSRQVPYGLATTTWRPSPSPYMNYGAPTTSTDQQGFVNNAAYDNYSIQLRNTNAARWFPNPALRGYQQAKDTLVNQIRNRVGV